MAKVAATVNSYAAPGEIRDNDAPTYAPPNSGAYAVPAPNRDAENGVMDSPIGAWAPELRAFPGGTPDPQRLGRMPVRDFRPNPAQAPERFFSANGAEFMQRHNAEMQDADGWTEAKGGSGKPTARDPRAIPPPEPRPTSRLAPRTYTFLRTLWGAPLRLNGLHFSMADHRRDYPILGTQPVRTWRNTFRIEPTPWDADMIDMPPNSVTDIPFAVFESVEVPAVNPWRL